MMNSGIPTQITVSSTAGGFPGSFHKQNRRGRLTISPKKAFNGFRRGAQTLEILLVLPIFIIGFLAVIQFGVMILIHHAALNATEETARELSKVYEFDATDPQDIDEVSEVADEIMGVHGITLGDPGLLVVVEDINGVACLGDPALEPRFCPPVSSVSDNRNVKVSLFLLIENTPVPQLLKTFCIDFTDKHYQFCSIMRKAR